MKSAPLTPNAFLRWNAAQEYLAQIAAGCNMLEIGPGQGAVAVRLATRYNWTGVETDSESFKVAARRLEDSELAHELLPESYESLVGARRFDAVLAFEVLEHLESDESAIQSWASLLTPGGRILMSTPAGSDRFAAADSLAGHYRRYDPGQLTELLSGAGLVEVRERLYGWPVGYLLEAGRNMLARRARRNSSSMSERTSASGRWLQPSPTAGRVIELGLAPLAWLQNTSPGRRRGTGVIATAVRPR